MQRRKEPQPHLQKPLLCAPRSLGHPSLGLHWSCLRANQPDRLTVLWVARPREGASSSASPLASLLAGLPSAWPRAPPLAPAPTALCRGPHAPLHQPQRFPSLLSSRLLAWPAASSPTHQVTVSSFPVVPAQCPRRGHPPCHRPPGTGFVAHLFSGVWSRRRLCRSHTAGPGPAVLSAAVPQH